MARGFPITIKFSEESTRGLVKIVDTLGATVIDNTDGSYTGKTVSVRWVGYEMTSDTRYNIWDIAGDVIEDTPELATEEWTFTLADGSTVTKAVYIG